MANGTSSVIAAIGSKYYKCSVTVEGGEDAAENTALSGYTLLNTKNYEDWLAAYNEKNAGLSFDKKDNMNIALYTGSEYIPIVAAQEGEEYSHYKDGAKYPDLSLYEMIGDDLNLELSRYELQTDTVLFSGKNAHEISNYTGTGATLKDLLDSVGKTYTRNEVISTSVSHHVADSFGDYILEIYAPAGVAEGMYCSSISQFSTEYELLLSGDTTYEIIGAGVREVTSEKFDYDADSDPVYFDNGDGTYTTIKPYLRVLIR